MSNQSYDRTTFESQGITNGDLILVVVRTDRSLNVRSGFYLDERESSVDGNGFFKICGAVLPIRGTIEFKYRTPIYYSKVMHIEKIKGHKDLTSLFR